MLKDYLPQVTALRENLRAKGVKNIARFQLLREFNTRFFNGAFYRQHPHNGIMLLDFEDNRKLEGIYLKDVVQLCLQTDICKSMNLNMHDLLQMDLPTYEYLRRKIQEDNEIKSREASKMRDRLESQSQQLLGERNNVKRRP